MIVKSEAGHLFGPFQSVDVQGDRLSCDGTELCFSVIGAYTIIESNPPGWPDKYEWDGAQFVELPMPADEHADAAVAQWDVIKAERDRRTQEGGYKVGAHWYHSDQFSRIQQLGLVIMGANMPPGIGWKTLDNGIVSMTPTLAGQIFAAAAASDLAIYTAALVHKATMEASANPATYDLSAGWPVIYGAE